MLKGFFYAFYILCCPIRFDPIQCDCGSKLGKLDPQIRHLGVKEMALTEIQCKKAESRDKQYRLSDANGLSLVVDPNGNKYWSVRFKVCCGRTPIETLLDGKRVWAEKNLAQI